MMSKRRFLMVGSFSYYHYEGGLCDALSDSFNIIKFKINEVSFLRKIARIIQINNEFVEFVRENRPEVIFFYRTNIILPISIDKVRKFLPETKILLYHNDNPYFGIKNVVKYCFFRSIIPKVDLVYCYRKSNLLQATKLGAKRVALFLPHYCSRIHYTNLDDGLNKKKDVIFVGHYASDGREEYIDFALKSKLNIEVYGAWDSISIKYNWPKNVVKPSVFEDQYRNTIASAKIALCFLSKKNQDGYTRRCFEIPAIGTLLLSERSHELERIFVENEEVVFFSSKEEMVQKISDLLADPYRLNQITQAGHRKVKEIHSEFERAKMLIRDIDLKSD